MKHRKLYRYALALPLVVVAVSSADDMKDRAAGEMPVLKDSMASVGTVRASRLIGTTALDPAGKDIGTVNDIVVDSSRENVGYFVIARGGFVGMGQKLIALPFTALQFGGPAETRVYVRVPDNVMDKAPGFDDSKWPTEANADYYRSLDTYYNTQLAKEPMDQSAKANDADKAQKASGTIPEAAEPAWARRTSQIMDRAVISLTKGNSLGAIKDVVINCKTGHVEYAVLARGGGLVRETYYAIPLSQFRAQADGKKLVLNSTDEEIKAMPGFDKDHWPSAPDPRWTSDKSK